MIAQELWIESTARKLAGRRSKEGPFSLAVMETWREGPEGLLIFMHDFDLSLKKVAKMADISPSELEAWLCIRNLYVWDGSVKVLGLINLWANIFVAIEHVASRFSMDSDELYRSLTSDNPNLRVWHPENVARLQRWLDWAGHCYETFFVPYNNP